MQLTAVFIPCPEGFIGFVEEIPGTNTQGMTLDETRESLREAVALILESNLDRTQLAIRNMTNVIREPLEV